MIVMRQRSLADGSSVGGLALGALPFGTTVDEATAFAIMDRFIDGGGSVIDTVEANPAGHYLPLSFSTLVLDRWLPSNWSAGRYDH